MSSVSSHVGVKQGDLMSPLLLGLFIDGIEQRITSAAPGGDVTVGGRLCPRLFRADDSVLQAASSMVCK